MCNNIWSFCPDGNWKNDNIIQPRPPPTCPESWKEVVAVHSCLYWCLSLCMKMLKYIVKHQWNIFLTILCSLAFAWQLYGIMLEWITPSHTITDITEKRLHQVEHFPIIFKICPDPGFNTTILMQEGYNGTSSYFGGWSKYNGSVFGWAGHTDTNEIKSTVEKIYKKVQIFPHPEHILYIWVLVWIFNMFGQK